MRNILQLGQIDAVLEILHHSVNARIVHEDIEDEDLLFELVLVFPDDVVFLEVVELMDDLG